MQKWIRTLAVCCLLLALAACQAGQAKPAPKETAPSAAEEKRAEIHGVVNRLGEFMVLLSDEGEYLIFDLGPEVETDKMQEGDTVMVTYTGTLGSEDPVPVAQKIAVEGEP